MTHVFICARRKKESPETSLLVLKTAEYRWAMFCAGDESVVCGYDPAADLSTYDSDSVHRRGLQSRRIIDLDDVQLMLVDRDLEKSCVEDSGHINIRDPVAAAALTVCALVDDSKSNALVGREVELRNGPLRAFAVGRSSRAVVDAMTVDET